MDIISHALVGAGLGELARPRSRTVVALAAFCAAAPDLPQAVALYPYVAHVAGRGLVPDHADWDGFRDVHPYATAVWELPHSVFFLLLVVIPLTRWRRASWTLAGAYASHLALDVVTHTGEWAVAPLWPVPWRVEGFSDPWRWTPLEWAASIAACACFWLALRWYARRAAPTLLS